MLLKKMLLFVMLGTFIGVRCSDALEGQLEKDRKLLAAAEAGNTAQVKSLLARNATISCGVYYGSGQTALHLAAANGHVKTVLALLEAKACVREKCSDGYAVLHTAALLGGSKVVQLLLDNGAVVNDVNRSWEAPLYYAVKGGSVETVATLLAAGACINKANEDGWTALHRAADEGRYELVQFLISHRASVEVKDNNGCTALNRAVLEPIAVTALIDGYYNALIARCPVVADMPNGVIETQGQSYLPVEVWELIVKNFSPREIASFRFVCKYFRLVVAELFEGVRKACAPRLKNKLIEYIESAVRNPKMLSFSGLARGWRNGEFASIRQAKEKYELGIDLLKTELGQARMLELEGLLQGKIICDGQPRFYMTQPEVDWSQRSCAIS